MKSTDDARYFDEINTLLRLFKVGIGSTRIWGCHTTPCTCTATWAAAARRACFPTYTLVKCRTFRGAKKPTRRTGTRISEAVLKWDLFVVYVFYLSRTVLYRYGNSDTLLGRQRTYSANAVSSFLARTLHRRKKKSKNCRTKRNRSEKQTSSFDVFLLDIKSGTRTKITTENWFRYENSIGTRALCSVYRPRF